MCGIAGFFDKDVSIDKKAHILEQMEKPLVCRGPDDRGVYVDEDVAVLHRRLSIVDLQHGKQPLFSENKDVVLICNGEIYNAFELRSELEKRHLFSTNSDNEIIVHLYEDYGIDAVKHLRGMFAFALWDKRNKLLILARDRSGEKPLYYYYNNELFAFSSLISSLACHPKVNVEIDVLSVSKYLTYDFTPSPNTPFLKIKKVKPGHAVVFDIKTDTLKDLCYWDVKGKLIGSSFMGDKEKKFELLEHLFISSVKEQFMSDVPVTLLLSGGIDSSLIAYFAAKEAKGLKEVFTLSFGEKSYDESRYAEYVSRFLGLKLNKIVFPTVNIDSIVSKSIECFDEPIADPSIVPTYYLLNNVSKMFKVALGGDGGDELFVGYVTFVADRIVNLYNFFPRTLREPLNSFLKKMIPVSPKYMSLNFKLSQFMKGAGLPPEVRFFTWIGSFSEEEKMDLWSRSIKRYIYDSPEKNTFEDIYSLLSNVNINKEIDELIYLCFKLYLSDDILVKTDRTGMGNSLEVRAPFLDYRLIEFAFRIPYFEKFRYLKTKLFLKNFARRYLPKKIIDRPKKGFTFPLANMINKDLKEIVDDTLLNANNPLSELFNRNYIEKLLKDHRKKVMDNRKKIWSLFALFYWADHFSKSFKSITLP